MDPIQVSAVVQGFSAFITMLVTIAIWRVYVGQKGIMDLQRAAMDDQRKQQNFIQVMNYMQADHMRENRAKVWTAIGRQEHSADEKAFSHVMSSFELLACYVETGVLDQKQFSEYWGAEVVEIFDAAPEKLRNYPGWSALREQVELQRSQMATASLGAVH